jgi:hypothetical protein
MQEDDQLERQDKIMRVWWEEMGRDKYQPTELNATT